jgi:hypothetical protein
MSPRYGLVVFSIWRNLPDLINWRHPGWFGRIDSGDADYNPDINVQNEDSK